MLIGGELQGHPVDLLIDTGARVSATNETLVKRFMAMDTQQNDRWVSSVH